MLGISGMATQLDMTGTMLITSFFYLVGIKGFLVGFRGEVVTSLSFLMVIGVWLRRGNSMTNAEYMKFRFGTEKAGQAARIFNAIATLILNVTLIGYLAYGSGKFLSVFLPFSPNTCAVSLVVIATVYTATSGLFGVAFTDTFQSLVIAFGIFFVAITAFLQMDFSAIQSIAPAGWTDIKPTWTHEFPPGYEGYNMFGFVLMAWVLKEAISGFSAGGMGYDMHQRYYAAKNEREASLLGLTWISTFAMRWPFIMGVAILALPLAGNFTDPELALPEVFKHYLPVGVTGLLISALLAAQMSSFDTQVNVGASYFVNDLYKQYLLPGKSERHYVVVSYVATISIVVVALSIAFFTESINAIWSWIIMSFGAPLSLPMLLRFYWWRYNGWGYACGCGAGMIMGITQRFFIQGMPEYMNYVLVLSTALIGCIVGTLLTGPVPNKNIVEFYRRVHPMGFWRPVKAQVLEEERRQIKKEIRWILRSISIFTPWQWLMFLTPMYFIMHHWVGFGVTFSILIILIILLYFQWYKKLPVWRKETEPPPA